jgi:hypothetical protein
MKSPACPLDVNPSRRWKKSNADLIGVTARRQARMTATTPATAVITRARRSQ